MTSHEKIIAALDRLEQLSDSETLEPQVRAMALGALVFRGQLVAALPASAEELDELLMRGAEWMLALRSDQAAYLAVAGGM